MLDAGAGETTDNFEVSARFAYVRGLDEDFVRARIDLLETELVTQALDRTGGNQTQAAKLLGVSRYGLHKMIKRLGLTKEVVRKRKN